MGFAERIKAYNAQKDTKVNPPEAKTVLETKSEPEVENVKPGLVSATPQLFGDAPAAAAEPSATASAEAPKAKRGRPAGSKNSAKQPEPELTTEVTSAASSDAPAPTAEAERWAVSELDYLLGLVRRRLPAGVTVTIVGG